MREKQSLVAAAAGDLSPSPERALLAVIAAVSLCHLLNDMMQSLLPSIYPILKSSFNLTFSQIGLITFTFQITASILQPFIGHFTDRRPMPYSLPFGMGTTLLGILLLARAPSFGVLLVAASLIGIGSAVFHPESSRVARLASGGQHGMAQSFFQVGGNAGSASGPLLAALIILPRGQAGVAWFGISAILGMSILWWVSGWYKKRLVYLRSRPARERDQDTHRLPRKRVLTAMFILMVLVFSKYFYLASLTSYYTFYLISKFHISVMNSQIHLFVFLGAVAAGTMAGGSMGDRFGRKLVIWCSILGVLPFTLTLPYANLFWTGVLSVIIGFVIASAFSAILVFAQELVPGRVGMISGLFFGFAFGMGGIGAAVLGKLADTTSVAIVYQICSYLPAIGLLTTFLPTLRKHQLSQV